MKIADRVKELRRVRASDLLANPKNWREHPDAQRKALRGVLEEIGYAGALLARETPEGLMLIDGHLRAETTPDQEVPVLVVDVTEKEAEVLLATIDPLAAMAGRNEEALAELLEGIEVSNEALSEFLDEFTPDDSARVKLRALDTQAPPAMSWVLVGIPTVRYGEINEVIEGLAARDGVIVETTVSDE